MKFNKLLIAYTILIFCLGINRVYAESCDNNDIGRLRVIANDVDISYEYNDNIYDNDGFIISDTYKIFISNVTDELYVKESKLDLDLRDYPISDGTITIDRIYSGKKTFKIYSKACNKVLKTKYITLPKFNYYSTDPNCKGKEDLEICQKFYDSSNIDYSEFLTIIDNYSDAADDHIEIKNDENNKYINFIIDNYLYFVIGGGIFVILIVAIIILRHKKRGALE